VLFPVGSTAPAEIHPIAERAEYGESRYGVVSKGVRTVEQMNTLLAAESEKSQENPVSFAGSSSDFVGSANEKAEALGSGLFIYSRQPTPCQCD
jgi:hypothetical protein